MIRETKSDIFITLWKPAVNQR